MSHGLKCDPQRANEAPPSPPSLTSLRMLGRSYTSGSAAAGSVSSGFYNLLNPFTFMLVHAAPGACPVFQVIADDFIKNNEFLLLYMSIGTAKPA